MWERVSKIKLEDVYKFKNTSRELINNSHHHFEPTSRTKNGARSQQLIKADLNNTHYSHAKKITIVTPKLLGPSYPTLNENNPRNERSHHFTMSTKKFSPLEFASTSKHMLQWERGHGIRQPPKFKFTTAHTSTKIKCKSILEHIITR